MNPEAPEFQPPGARNRAWSNPAKSVSIAKLPPRRRVNIENQDQISSSGLVQKDFRILPRPEEVRHSSKSPEDEEKDWKTIGKKGRTLEEEPLEKDDAPILSEEDLEIKRKQRRERRQRAKEVKKVKKEEERRKKEGEKLNSMRASKDTKIKLVDAGIITQFKTNNQASSSKSLEGKGVESKPTKSPVKSTNLRFLEEEYPTLGGATFVKSTKDKQNITKSYESGSEWETEDESSTYSNEKNDTVEEITEKLDKIEVVSNEPMSFKSILKKPPSKNPILNELSDVIATTKIKKGKFKALPATQNEVKKVKKKDPITFDIFDALNSKKKVSVTKPAMVLGSKIKPQIPIIRNVLDSSAPSKRRGKEREKPRKKRPTKMKKLILLSRANKKATREANQAICLEIQAESCLDNTPLSEPNSSIELCNEELPEKENKNLVTDNKCKEDAEDNNISALAEEIKTVAIPEQSVMDKAKLLLHSRKFRNYCDHELSKDIDELVVQLIQDIVRFQDRQFAKDPLKAKSKKRYVVGLREIKKFLQVKKITLLILAPDVETVQIKGGLDDTISELIRLAKENEIPYVFTMNRWRLGKTCLRKVPISGIGVLNHQGSDENYMKIKEVLPLLQLDYKTKLLQALKDVNAPKDFIEEFSTLLK